VFAVTESVDGFQDRPGVVSDRGGAGPGGSHAVWHLERLGYKVNLERMAA
jgi:hypothetical protein